MKSRSCSPVHVHVDNTTPVHVHIQRSQSLPSSIEREGVLRTSTPDPCLKNTGKSPHTEGNLIYKSSCTKEHKALNISSITPRHADKICSVIQSSDSDFGHTEEQHPKGGAPSPADDIESERVSAHGDPIPETPHGFSIARDDPTSSWGGRRGEQGSRLSTRSSLIRSDVDRRSYGDYEQKKLLLKTLIDAEMAANSAAVQLISFKELLFSDVNESRSTYSDDRCLSRQKNLLLEKLEMFTRINKSVRQQLKELQYHEANLLEADRQVDILLKKLTQTEAENWQLKRNLSEKERKVEELMDLRKKEMENASMEAQLSKSADTIRAHLQGQLRIKESENSRLTVQLRCLERTLADQKLEVGKVKGEMSALSEKSMQEKEALKKATRAQKRRAERFETSMERCYAQIREKDLRLAQVSAEAGTWRTRLDQVSEEKAHLQLQIDILKTQIRDMTAEVEKEQNATRASNEELLQKVEKLHVEKEELGREDEALKARVSEMEGRVVQSRAELEKQAANTQEQKELAEQYRKQAGNLEKELADLKIKFEEALRENEVVRAEKQAEVEKMQKQLEVSVRELEAYPGLLNVAQKTLHNCTENLLSFERSCSDKSESLRQLQDKSDRQAEQLTSSLAMKRSIDEANAQLQLRVDCLQRKTEEIQRENEELVHKLASQEEALQYSSSELERRSAECQSLSRHLEAALADVKMQVANVKGKADAREGSLQKRILELEAEQRRRESEMRRMRQSNRTVEKHYEARLKDLRLSLEQSECHKRSIHNYVDFLKSSYTTMFDDGSSKNLGRTPFLK